MISKLIGMCIAVMLTATAAQAGAFMSPQTIQGDEMPDAMATSSVSKAPAPSCSGKPTEMGPLGRIDITGSLQPKQSTASEATP